jgi:large subunit ribosomal protein L16
MLLKPKKLQFFKKLKKGKLKRLEFKANILKFGDFGIKAIESGIITARHIEAARCAIQKHMKRRGKIWIRIFPSLPISAKSKESRMGKGKGSIVRWGAKVRRGTVLFELTTFLRKDIVFASLESARHRLPIKTKLILIEKKH